MRALKITVTLTILVMLILSAALPVYAAGLFEDPYDPNKTGEYVGYMCESDSSTIVKLSKEAQKIYDVYSSGGQVTITIQTKDKSSKDFIVTEEGYNKFVALGKQIYDKQSVKHKVSSMGENFNVQADTEEAGNILGDFSPLISVGVGILAYAVAAGLTLFTALDMCYITMPIFREKCDNMKQSGNGLMVKTDKRGETKLRWVTDEAQYAVEYCTIESGQNPYWVYFKKRVLAHIITAIILYILLTGNIQLLINIAINLVDGILDALATLGS